MDNTFISFFLLFCLTLLLIMYLNQNMKCNKHKNPNQHNLVIHPSPNTQHNNINNINNKNNYLHKNNSNSITNIFDTCKSLYS